MRKISHALALAIAMSEPVLLAGCAPPVAGNPAGGFAAPPIVLEAPQPRAALPPPRPAHKPAPPADASAATANSFEELNGLDQSAARMLFGEPQQKMEQPPAVVWRYAKASCDLDLYFYLDLRTGEMRVLHYEVRTHDGAKQLQQRCYAELVGERRSQGAPASTTDPAR